MKEKIEEGSISKRLKISKAQQNMLMTVAGASLILGVCLVFAVYFLKYIKFNSVIISEKGKAIVAYSNTIRNTGICKKPSGEIYNSSELDRCNPNETRLEEVPDTLRYRVIKEVSRNKSLESVGRDSLTVCYKSTSSQEKWTFDEIYEKYSLATTDKQRAYYLEMLGLCSSLRVIPDALPSSANALALGASLSKIFAISRFEPEGINTGDTKTSSIDELGAIGIGLEIESDSRTTMTVLRNIEKSIREINIETASIERRGDLLRIQATAAAYYTDPVTLSEKTKQIQGNGKVINTSDQKGVK